MADAMSPNNHQSPAVKVMNDAIELAIEERSPFPDRCAFVNADTPSTGAEIKRALDEDMAIVLVFPDCSTRTLHAEPASS
jgi:hypothetical protein